MIVVTVVDISSVGVSDEHPLIVIIISSIAKLAAMFLIFASPFKHPRRIPIRLSLRP